jgi:NADH-quinone oxidoreductase subunit K
VTPTLQVVLIVSAALFSAGLLAALSRRHAIFILIGIEMMLGAANLNFIAFWRFWPSIAATDWYYDRDFLNRYCCC